MSEARETVRKAILACKEQSRQEDTDKLPDNFGTLLVAKSKELRAMGFTIAENARLDGAIDEDIEEWWNLHDLQRRMVIWHENAFRYANFLSLREDGLNADEAMVRVRAMFPMYGDPNDRTHTKTIVHCVMNYGVASTGIVSVRERRKLVKPQSISLHSTHS
jgi:hypothetical protein